MLTFRQLSLIILIGAPFLLIGTQVEAHFPALAHSRWTGLWGFLYLSSWLASIEILRRSKATGTSCQGLCALWTVMVLLALANVSNLWQIVVPGVKPALFQVLDMGWQLSYLMMPVLGILMIKEKNNRHVSTFKPYSPIIPLLMALWLPISLIADPSVQGLWFTGLYSLGVWSYPALWMFYKAYSPLQPVAPRAFFHAGIQMS